MVKKRLPTKKTSPQKSTAQRMRVRQAAFLAALAFTGIITSACDDAEIDRKTAYNWRHADPKFAVLWDEALIQASDRIEREALRRAKEGTLKPIYQKGELMGYERVYSDTLMVMMLKASKPDKYKDKLEISIKSEDLAILKKYGYDSPSRAWEEFIQELDKNNA